jgi:hypothetical protein
MCNCLKGYSTGFTTMTYGGVSLTKRREGFTTADGQVWAIFTLDNPTAGTANLVTTHTNSGTAFGGRIAVVVQNTAGYGSYVDTDTSNSTKTLDITSATGRLVIGYYIARSGSGLTVGSGQTLLASVSTNPQSIASSEAGASTVTTSFTDSGGSSFTVIAVDMLAEVTAALVFAQEPSNAWTAEVIRPAITVNLTTDGSTIDTGATDTVTVAIASGTGTLGGTTAVAAVAGVATFSTLTVTGSGAHTLTATATGYTADTSASFKVATGTGVPGGGVIILGGQMQRAMKDAETTAARKRVFFDIRDSAGAGWAGSVTGVKAQRSLSGATIAATTNDIVRVGGAMHYVELTDAEAAAGAAGDVIGCYVAADTGRLESTHGFYEITADDVAAAAITDASVSAAVLSAATSTPIAAAVQTMAANSVTASALATDAVTEIANAVVEAEIDALETYNRTSNTAATITGPTSGAVTLTIATDAAYEPIKSIA